MKDLDQALDVVPVSTQGCHPPHLQSCQRATCTGPRYLQPHSTTMLLPRRADALSVPFHLFCTALDVLTSLSSFTGSCDRQQIMPTKAPETKKKVACGSPRFLLGSSRVRPQKHRGAKKLRNLTKQKFRNPREAYGNLRKNGKMQRSPACWCNGFHP